MSLLNIIGKPIEDPGAQMAMAWEMVPGMWKTEEEGKKWEEVYNEAREKAALLFKKLTDQKTDQLSDFVEVHLPNWINKVQVNGQGMEKFLGHYSLTSTMHPYTAGIVTIQDEATAILCVASQPGGRHLVFCARAGTLEQTNNLYDALFGYMSAGSNISAYIVAQDSLPVVIQAEEEKKEEKPKTKKPKTEEKKEEKHEAKEPETKKPKTEEKSEAEKPEAEIPEAEKPDAEEKKPRKVHVIRRKRLQE